MRSVVWWWLVVMACTPVQPQPSYFSQQQPYQQQQYPQQPYPQQQPYSQQAPTNGATCSQVVGCYLGSTTQDSINACEVGVDPSVVSTSRAVVQCSASSQCRDAACLETSCSAQLSACNWHPQATAPTQVGQHGSVPSSGHVRVLVGLKPLGSGATGGGYRQTRVWGWYVLFDDGRYFTSLPLTGLYGVDESKLAYPGSYVDRGNRIETAATQFTSGMSFERQRDGSWSGDTTYTLVDALDNAVLEGAYAKLGYGRAKTGAAPDLAFSRDGRFNANQFYISDGSSGTGSRVVPAGTGTYRILQNTLMLTYSTGQTIWLSIVALQANELPRPTDLFIAGEQYQSP